MEPYTVALDASEIPLCFDVRDGQCVALAGTPRYVRPVALGSSEKDPNVTGSAPYVERLALAEEGDGAVRLSARLGNNGALVLPDDVEPEPPVVDPDNPEPEPNPKPEPEPNPKPEPEQEPGQTPDEQTPAGNQQTTGQLADTGDPASPLVLLALALAGTLALLYARRP